MNIPIYTCYGTADRTASLNDLLPILDYDHNFYQLVRDGKGQVVDQIYKGDEVAGDYLNWLNSH